MDPAGFTVGIVSLAALFQTCLELADYISLANNLGHDYETAFTRFLLLKSRLYALKPCLTVLEHTKPLDKCSEERMLVGRTLVAMKALLEDGQKLETKYGLREREDAYELANRDDQRELSESFLELELVLDRSAARRQQKTSWNKKLRWAVKDKKGFDRLIGDLSFYINELENLSARLQIPIPSFIQQRIQSITAPATMQLLEEAVAAPDMDESNTSTAGHVYVRNQVAEHARVLFGNADMPDNTGKSHYYAGNQVIGNARVIFGNASQSSLSQFWGS